MAVIEKSDNKYEITNGASTSLTLIKNYVDSSIDTRFDGSTIANMTPAELTAFLESWGAGYNFTYSSFKQDYSTIDAMAQGLKASLDSHYAIASSYMTTAATQAYVSSEIGTYLNSYWADGIEASIYSSLTTYVDDNSATASSVLALEATYDGITAQLKEASNVWAGEFDPSTVTDTYADITTMCAAITNYGQPGYTGPVFGDFARILQETIVDGAGALDDYDVYKYYIFVDDVSIFPTTNCHWMELTSENSTVVYGGKHSIYTDPITGAITGFNYIGSSSGNLSDFTIYADKFSIYTPTGAYTPFEVVGGSVIINGAPTFLGVFTGGAQPSGQINGDSYKDGDTGTIYIWDSSTDLWISSDAADGKFRSVIFKRSAAQPAAPLDSEGDFINPVPAGWSDGIPPENAAGDPVWGTSRLFTLSGNSPQETSWRQTVVTVDNGNINYQYNDSATLPGDPGPLGTDNGWTNTSSVNSVWIAQWVKQNGEDWVDGVSWQIAKIKGEDGANGATGVRGSASTSYSADEGVITVVDYANSFPSKPASAWYSGTGGVFGSTNVRGDTVIVTNTNVTTGWTASFTYTGSGWGSFDLVVHGDAIIEGTLDVNRITAGPSTVYPGSGTIVANTGQYIGVEGNGTSYGVVGYGVTGVTGQSTTGGTGVSGYSSQGIAGQFVVSSAISSSIGVYASSASGYAGYFTSTSGVAGKFTSSSNLGIEVSTGTGATAIKGTGGTGVWAVSTSSYALYSQGTSYSSGRITAAAGISAVGSGTNYGVNSTSSNGIAVYGNGGSSYGVYGASSSVAGVYGTGFDGCYGYSTSSSGTALVGRGSGKSIYGDGAIQSYINNLRVPGGVTPFTGVHEALIHKSYGNLSETDYGKVFKEDVVHAYGDISNATSECKLSSTSKDKTVIGVLSRVYSDSTKEEELKSCPFVKEIVSFTGEVDSLGNPETSLSYESLLPIPLETIISDYHYVKINAVGEGLILASSDGGDIAAGDFLVTSGVVEGAVVPQGTDILTSSTVAKARVGIIWANETVTQKLIPCFYMCG